MILAPVNAASAEGALCGVISPRVLFSSGFEGDGARGAAEPAHGAAGASRGIEMHQAAKSISHRRGSGVAKGRNASSHIVPEQREDLHDRNLMNNAEEMAATAKTSVHCQ